MVDAVHVPAAVDRQDVTALAVSVVDGRIEDRHPPQAWVVLVDPADDVDRLVGLDERLDHPVAERTVAQHGGRDDVPAARLGDEVGGDLAAGQRPIGEVVELPLPDGRLMDRLEDSWRLTRVGAGKRHRDEQRVVARPDDATDDLDLPVAEDLQGGRAVEHAGP